MLEVALVERSVSSAQPLTKYQFERVGYTSVLTMTQLGIRCVYVAWAHTLLVHFAFQMCVCVVKQSWGFGGEGKILA